MVSLSAPVPLWPLLPLQVALVTPAGSGSLTATLVAVLGPVVLMPMVYVVLVQACAEVMPSVLVTPTSTCGVSVSVSVALSLAGLVSLGVVVRSEERRVGMAGGSICTVKV